MDLHYQSFELSSHTSLSDHCMQSSSQLPECDPKNWLLKLKNLLAYDANIIT